MSDFVFIGRVDGGAISSLQAKMPSLVSALGYRVEEVKAFKSTNGSMAALQFSRGTNLYGTHEQCHVDAAGRVTLLKGHLIRKGRDDAQVLSAAEVGKHLSQTDPRAFRSDLTGDFGVCHFDDDRAQFFCDPLSMVAIFYCLAKDGTCIVATRPRLIREILPDWEFDFGNLVWQAIAYWPIDDGTLLKSVRRIPQAGILEWDRLEARIKLRESPLFFLGGPASAELSQALMQEPTRVLDRVISRMGAALQAVLRKAPKATLGITGGKDSRAIAALVSMGGGGLDNLELFTNGVSDHPDVVVGRTIAEKIGAKFSNRVPGSASYSARRIIRQRLGAVFRYDGMLPMWDGGGDPGISSQVLLQGHVGEVYRDKWFKGSFASPEAFARYMLNSGSLDPNRLLRQDVAQEFERQLKNRAAYYLDNGARKDQLAGVFRVEGMQSWESAQYSQGALWANHPVHPLYDPEMIDVAFAASPEWRDDERIHYEIIKRSGVDLIGLPFAEYGWHKGLQKNAGCNFVNVEPIRNVRALVSAAGWQSGLFFSSPLQRFFLEIFESCEASPLWEYLDRDKALSIIRGAAPDLGGLQMSRMYSVFTSLCHAHGYEIPLKFDALPGSESMEARTILVGEGTARLLYDGRRSVEIVGELDQPPPGVPEMQVAEGVVRLLAEAESNGESDKDLYDLFAQLRQVTLEKRKLERENQKPS